jgi:hypothetical protein
MAGTDGAVMKQQPKPVLAWGVLWINSPAVAHSTTGQMMIFHRRKDVSGWNEDRIVRVRIEVEAPKRRRKS